MPRQKRILLISLALMALLSGSLICPKNASSEVSNQINKSYLSPCVRIVDVRY